MVPYMGGKYYLSKWIIENFPKNYKDMSYVEVFGGAGWVLLKKEPSALEIYNDKNEDLVNLFRIIRDRYRDFKLKAHWALNCRTEFDMAKARIRTRNFKDDLDKALCFALLQCLSFSATGSSYGYSRSIPRTGRWYSFLKRLFHFRNRFKYVNIECLDFEDLIQRYDSKNTLFYLDPPYYGKEFYYDVPFGEQDHIRLAGILKKIEGKFALSYYPCELIDRYYKRYKIISKDTVKHSCGSTRASKIMKKPKAKELLIRNYV